MSLKNFSLFSFPQTFHETNTRLYLVSDTFEEKKIMRKNLYKIVKEDIEREIF